MGCVASVEDNTCSTRRSIKAENLKSFEDGGYSNLKPKRKELIEWLDDCELQEGSPGCDFDAPTQDQLPSLSMYTYGVKKIRKEQKNFQNTNKGMKIKAYSCWCLYDAEQNPKSGVPQQNADLIKSQINFVGNNKLQMKGDRKCVVNNKITIEIVTSCITRQYASSLVAEVVDKKVDHNLVLESGQDLQAYYDLYQKRFNEVSPGGVCVTSPADLGSKNVNNVILLNTPEYQNDRTLDRLSLETSILNVLDAALEMETDSLAMPALAAKSRDFPVNDSAEIMLYWIIEWCHLHNTGNLKTIKIVNSDPQITDQFKTTLSQIVDQRKWVQHQDLLGL